MWGRLILFMLCLTLHARGDVVINNNLPQNPCPPGGSCLVDDAVCDTESGDCVCGGNFTNQPMDGRLDCYKDTERFARIVNDPRIKVFDRATYKFLLPCRALFSHVGSHLRTAEEGKVGKCVCKVYFWNRKKRGKIFTHGFDFTCRVRRKIAPRFTTEFTTRIYGLGYYGFYAFDELGSLEFEDGSPEDIRVSINQSGIHYQSQYDLVNNRVILDFWSCGHRVTFSPYGFGTDDSMTNQPYLPGLSVAVDTAVAPKFRSRRKVMATGASNLGGLPIESALIRGLDLETSFIFRALKNAPPQSEPHANPQCVRGKSIIKKCTSRKMRTEVQERCNFIFDYAKLMNCLDDTVTGEKLVFLYLACVEAICDPLKPCSGFVDNLLTYSASCRPEVTDAVPEYQLHVNGTWTC